MSDNWADEATKTWEPRTSAKTLQGALDLCVEDVERLTEELTAHRAFVAAVDHWCELRWKLAALNRPPTDAEEDEVIAAGERVDEARQRLVEHGLPLPGAGVEA